MKNLSFASFLMILLVTSCSNFEDISTLKAPEHEDQINEIDYRAANDASGSEPCELTGTWNGKYGADHDCDTTPYNCYTCPVDDTNLPVFQEGHGAVQDFFASGQASEFFPELQPSTIEAVMSGEFELVQEDYVFLIVPFNEGYAPLSLEFTIE